MPVESLLPFDKKSRLRARNWLMLGVLALGVAGICAGLLANTKSAFFYKALVVHVDLSELVWFLTMTCLFFTLCARGHVWAMLADAGFYSFAGGTLLIALSLFCSGEPYQNNYIPVIYHPMFFLGLSLILCGTACMAIYVFRNKPSVTTPAQYGVIAAMEMLWVAILLFIDTPQSLPTDPHGNPFYGQVYYEYIFWGGGHVLQFVYAQLMMVAWLWLAEAANVRIRLKNWQPKMLFGLPLIPVFASLLIGFFAPATTDANRNGFTLLMKHANGLMPIVLGLIILFSALSFPFSPSFQRKLESPSLRNGIPVFAGMTVSGGGLPGICLFMSMLLFGVGGGLGYLIKTSNLTTPAHYHGSIVGVTLAFMGVAYQLLPSLGYADMSRSKLAKFQPVLYGGGQLCWIAGMVILGAHGVPRKTPGSADTVGALAAFLKHGGDGLALLGGLLFVFVMLKAVCKHSRLSETAS